MKDIILWKYERASWQWDVLCLLILAFIFLTPRAWFDKKEKSATQTARLAVKAEEFPIDKTVLENRLRELSESENAEISHRRKKTAADGRKIYEH